MSRYDLGETLRMQLQPQSKQTGPRDIETITGEIIQLKQDAGDAILAIGQRLNEAKSILSDGEWLPWLTEQVDFSPRTAQRFMRLAREWSDATALSHLGATKALTLLALPPEERDSFMAENHLVDGEEKNVIDMTSRELQKAIQERNDALQAAEAAKAHAQAAEDSVAQMAADIAALESVHQAAQEGEAQALQELEAVRAELQALRDKPVDVAVQTVVDEEAVKKARDEAVAAMKAKVDQAESARKDAEAKRKSAEKDLAEAKKQAGANAAILSRAEKAEAELAEVRRQLEAAEAPVRWVRWESRGRTPPTGGIILTYSLTNDGPVYLPAVWDGSQFISPKSGKVLTGLQFTQWLEIPLPRSVDSFQLAPPEGVEGQLVFSGWMPGGTLPMEPCDVVADFSMPGIEIRKICRFDGKNFLFACDGSKIDAECVRWMVLPPVEEMP